jgi:hypothetical protein
MNSRSNNVVIMHPWWSGLLPNGNFEQGPDKSQLNGTRVVAPNAIPSWQISGFVEYIESGQKQDDMILPVSEGARAVRLGSNASIRQMLVGLTRRTYYSITFCAARTCAQAEKVRVSVTPDSGVLPIQTVYTSSGWDCYSWAFKAKHTAVWLSIEDPDSEEDEACGPVIDSVAIKTLHHPHIQGRATTSKSILMFLFIMETSKTNNQPTSPCR